MEEEVLYHYCPDCGLVTDQEVCPLCYPESVVPDVVVEAEE